VNIIDFYHFGQIVINGKRYSSDVIVFPDRVRDNWERKIGHQLCLEDITGAIAENPELLVVGTGASGLMRVLPEVHEEVDTRKIKLIAEATDKAWHTYNQFCHSQKVVAALHLTC